MSIEEDIFIGRVEEQNRFRKALHDVLRETGLIAKLKAWRSRRESSELPYIFVLYGEGGMGKSRLARCMRDIALTEPPFRGRFRTVWLDWENRKALDLKLIARDAVSPETLFEHIHVVFRSAGFTDAFAAYEKALHDRAEAETKVAQTLNSIQEEDERFATLREVGAKGLAWLVASGLIGGTPIPVPEELLSKAFGSLLDEGSERLGNARAAATTLLRAALRPEEFDLFTVPNETLALRLADGIRAAASKPIIFVLDTYEIADRADSWLRIIMKRAGMRVVWIIAGRDNLVESRKFGQHYFVGYGAEFSSDRLRDVRLGEFSVRDVRDYFHWRAGERELDENSVQSLHRATLGIPLAVHEAAEIWKTGVPLDQIVGDMPQRAEREQIVKVMSERFMLHCFDDPRHVRDRVSLYGLALAHQADPDLLAAILECDDLERTLSDLERRYSFVFVSGMKLHDSVSAFLREYLSHDIRRRSLEVRGIHERATAYLRSRMTGRERNAALLELRISDKIWVSTILSLVHHEFWLNEERGWDALMPSILCALAYDASFARALVSTTELLSALLSEDGKKRLSVLKSGATRINPNVDAQNVLQQELANWERRWPADGCASERRAILNWQRGKQLHGNERYLLALEAFAQSTNDLPAESSVLKARLAESIVATAFSLGFDKDFYALPSESAADAYRQAIALGDDSARTFRRLGRVQMQLGHLIEAERNVSTAIAKNPLESDNHEVRAAVHEKLGEFEKSLADYGRAVELSPTNVYAYRGLARLYAHFGRYDDAIKHCRKAVELKPESADLRANVGNIYGLADRLDEALIEYGEALRLDPKASYVHFAMAAVYVQQNRFDDARRALNARVAGERENILIPMVAMGVISRHQGLEDSDTCFEGALANWESACRRGWSSKRCLHENRAIALLCLGRASEAIPEATIAVDAESWTSDSIETDYYRLLRSAPSPPPLLENMVGILERGLAARKLGRRSAAGDL
jgi:tetratricopeptide (TPR) repeat protein